jgi:hypothetical protein
VSHFNAGYHRHRTDDPLHDSWPFLLIARTGRIFTADVNP